MIVINTTHPPRPLVIAIPTVKTIGGCMQYEPTVLKPGSNEIPENTIFEESATGKDWVTRKWVDVKRPRATKENASPAGLTGFSLDASQYLVDQCFDTALLGRFNAIETRAEVKSYISDRLNMLKDVDKDRADE